jgi:glycosyltransferase involved in cell wall biosynthesis
LLTQQTGRPWLKHKLINSLLQTRTYDVIHFHNISLLGPAVLSLASSGSHSVRVYTTHEHWLVCPTHVLWKFDSRPCERPECFKCALRAKRPPQLWRYSGLLERMARHVDQFLAPSRFTEKMHAERGFQRPLEYLPNFIDRTDQDWQNPAPRPQERPYFLFVGRLETIKGLQTLIRLWDRIDWDLLVAGAGAAEGGLRTLAAGNPRIKFLGPLPQKDLAPLYYHALACIVPSITYETFGMTSVEAFARKTPAVVRDLGALPETVRDSGGGVVYKSDEELLDALKAIAGSPSLRNELGQKGYDGFVRWWSREAHLKLYFDMLNRVAERKLGRIPWISTPEPDQS